MRSKRSLPLRIARWLAGVTLALLLIAILALAVLFNFEQHTLRPLAERLVVSATGRAFGIDGELDLSAGRVVSLSAGGIRLANADWGQDQPMLAIGSLQVSFDLARLFGGVPAAENLVVDDLRLLVEQDDEGHSNWALGAPSTDAAEPSPEPVADSAQAPALQVLPVVRSELSNIDITVIDAALVEPLRIHLDRVHHRADAGDAVQAGATGNVKGRPFELETRIAPVSQLLAAGAIEVELTANSRSIDLDIEAAIDKLSAPGQVNAHIALAADDIARVLETLGLPHTASGALELNASLLPVGDEHAFDIAASIDSLSVDAQGRLQAFDRLDGASLSLSARGPDLATAGRLAGIEGLPVQAFEFATNASLDGARLTIGDTRFDSGDNHLAASGTMNNFPRIQDTELEVRLNGRNYLEFARLLGIERVEGLQPEPFEVTASLEYSDREQQRFDARLVLADVEGRFQGRLAAYPEFIGSQLDYRLEGRNDGLLQRILGRPTGIDGGYSLQGRVDRTAEGYRIDAARATIGANRLSADGTVGADPLQAGTALALGFEGPNLEQLVAIAGYDGFVPAGDADIDARATVSEQRLDLESLRVQLGRNRVDAKGRIGLREMAAGSRVEIALAGEDIVEVLPPLLHGFVDAGQAFAVDARLESDGERLGIDALQANLGANRLKASGKLSLRQPLEDTALTIDLDGPDLAEVVPDSMQAYRLPAEPFKVAGGIGFDRDGLRLEGIDAEVGKDRFGVSGSIPLDDPSEGLRLAVRASGPNLDKLVPVEIDQVDFAELPYEASAEIALGAGRLSIRNLDFSTSRGRISGQLALNLDDPMQFGEFDLDGQGENLAELLPDTPGFEPADVAFRLDAQGGWTPEQLHFDRGSLELGSIRVETQGKVNLVPGEHTARLVLSARGERLADFGEFGDLELPPRAFRIDAIVDGGADGIVVPKLDAMFGDSDLRGSIGIEYGEVPDVRVDAESRLMDLEHWMSIQEEDDESQPAQETAGDGRVIPQQPVPADRLRLVNLETRIRIGELRLKGNTLRNLVFDSSLRDGDLQVKKLEATATQGRIVASFRARAEGERIVTNGTLQGSEIVLGKAEDANAEFAIPKQDIEIDFATEGATTRELAANLNGYVQVVGGEGRLKNSYALGLFGSFFEELLGAINPFVTREPYTAITCFAAYAEIVDGIADIKPGAVMQTDKLDMFARGQVDLNNEQIALRFDTAARKGIGISVADFVNPFVGVSGTLAKPRLGVDPKNAMFEGGFAYATGGLSIVAKSLWRRWFGAKDPCVRLQQEALEYQKQKQEAAEKAAADKAATSEGE